jgi:hypothetical protein
MVVEDRGAVMPWWRLALGTVGSLVGLYGASQLLVHLPTHSLILVAVWLIAAVIIHDGLLSPVIVGVGSGFHRWVPDRGRRYLQAALIIGAMVTLIAIPMIYRQGTQPPSKAILLQNFGANLALLLGVIAGLTLIAYVVRVARDGSLQPPDQGA